MWTTAERRRYQRPAPRYETDLTDAEFARIAPHIPPAKPGGRPRGADERELLNAIPYQLRTGCQWRLLPKDFPPCWGTVYCYFRRWGREGLWDRPNDLLVVEARLQAGREASPSAAILDSQSVRTTERGAARLRRRQEDRRAQAAHPGRQPRPAAEGGGPPGRRPGPRRRAARPRPAQPALPVAGGGVRRRRLGRRQAGRAGPASSRLGPPRTRAPRPGDQGLSGAGQALGGGADLRLAGAHPAPEQGLRGADRDLDRLSQAGDDPAPRPPPRPRLITFSNGL
jgi:transposase